MMEDIRQKKGWASAVALGLILSLALGVWAGDTLSPKPTPYSMDLYGRVAGAVPGDVVKAYDSQGTLCGAFTVTKEGLYGFLHVYGDDRTTPVDEGALAGEPLAFRLNDEVLTPMAPEAVLWQVDSRQQVDFRR